MYYHVVTDLERKFRSIDAALDAYKNTKLIPRVPKHTMDDENMLIPRICVCEWLPDCLTAIGLRQRLMRCLGGNDCIDSLDPNCTEAYPVLVLEFSDKTHVYTPTCDDVPDEYITNEKWILRPTVPDNVYVRWVDSNSIIFKAHTEGPLEMTALSCNFVTDIQARNHPYLNGQGHILESAYHANEFEDYSKQPAGANLGTIFTVQSTIDQINDLMGWKEIAGEHEVCIKSEDLPENTGPNKTHLEIVCKAGNRVAPRLYLQLVCKYADNSKTEILAKSENFTNLAELQRTGINYQGVTYRPRLCAIKADHTTGHIPANPANMQNQDEDNIAQISIKMPDEMANFERH